MNGCVAKGMTQERRLDGAPRANLSGTVTGVNGGKGNGECEGKSEPRYCYACGEQGHIGVNCPYKWSNDKDEEDDQGSSWESVFEGRSQKNLRAGRHLMRRENGVGPNGTESTGGESEWTKGQHFTTLQKMTKKNRRLED